MKKKKILFVIPNLGAGGAEKSLVNLLNSFDFERYDVDLLLMHKSGIFLEMIPAEVKVLDVPELYHYFSVSFGKSLLSFVKKGRLDLIIYKILFTISNKSRKNKTTAEQINWQFMRHFFKGIETEYDVAIGYLEKSANYVVVDSIKARKKIGYIHNDYSAMRMDRQIDEYFFNKFDYIVTVSEKCVESLVRVFPQHKPKFRMIRNFTPINYIKTLANADQDEQLNGRKYILSIGRLSEQKSFHLAVDAFSMIAEKYHDLEWIVLGEGHLRLSLQEQINKKDVTHRFHLVGNKKNPYPYIANALLYVQTSIFEGKSIAIDEAKIFAKPIIVTDYPTAKDQIDNFKTGLIAEINSEDIAKKIEILVNNKQLRDELSKNLENEKFCDESEIEKLYKLIES